MKFSTPFACGSSFFVGLSFGFFTLWFAVSHLEFYSAITYTVGMSLFFCSAVSIGRFLGLQEGEKYVRISHKHAKECLKLLKECADNISDVRELRGAIEEFEDHEKGDS